MDSNKKKRLEILEKEYNLLCQTNINLIKNLDSNNSFQENIEIINSNNILIRKKWDEIKSINVSMILESPV